MHEYDSRWQEKYRDMIIAPEDVPSKIKPGQRVFIGTACAQPQVLVHHMTQQAAKLADVEIIHLLTFGTAPYADKKLSDYFRINSFFIASNVRETIQEGLGDYTPIFLSDIPRLFNSGQLQLDVALIHVSPPDANGRCSLGVSVDIVKSAAENASCVIAQVNPQMPRTLGNSFLSVHDIDYLVPVDTPIIEVESPEPNDVARQIAQNVASLVESGSTLELGIGRIPQSVLEFLFAKKDLGIHTEMITDSIVDLMKSGVITGKRKSFDKEKVVASFCLGTRKLYDFIHNNPAFSFQPTEYVNDPFIISQHQKMVAINVALEVDLTGQVCADSLGTRFFSGIGGQVDFNRGAARSKNGKAIIALPSTAKEGSVSRIVACLNPGAGVVTTRGDVHYVVTEYGVAYLHGKNVQERVLALISIAHPKFRARLLNDAIESKFLSPERKEIEGKIFIGPKELRTTYILNDGTQIYFRPIHPTDEPGLKELLYNLTQETIYYRFMSYMKRFPQKQIQNFVYINHRSEVAIVGTVPEASGDDILSIGRYYLDPKTNRAEVALTVSDRWQQRGIGTFLFHYLINIAKRNGIRGFTAEVLVENLTMQHIINNCGYKVNSQMRDRVYSYIIDFE